jgi:hypothetical protein
MTEYRQTKKYLFCFEFIPQKNEWFFGAGRRTNTEAKTAAEQ